VKKWLWHCSHFTFSSGNEDRNKWVCHQKWHLKSFCEHLGLNLRLICSFCVVLLAIDVTVNMLQSLEVIVSLGCDRVLTSGGEATALEGTFMIRKMIEQTAGRITIVPGKTQIPLRWLLPKRGKFRQKLRTQTVKVMDAIHEAGMSRGSFGLSSHLNTSRWLRQSPRQICLCRSNGI